MTPHCGAGFQPAQANTGSQDGRYDPASGSATPTALWKIAPASLPGEVLVARKERGESLARLRAIWGFGSASSNPEFLKPRMDTNKREFGGERSVASPPH